MVFGNGVKNIQATAYNGTRMVYKNWSNYSDTDVLKEAST